MSEGNDSRENVFRGNLENIRKELKSLIAESKGEIHKTHLSKCQKASELLDEIVFETDRNLYILDMNNVLMEKEFEPDYEIKKEGWSRVGKSLIRATDMGKLLLNNLFNTGNIHGKDDHIAIWSSAYRSNVIKYIKTIYPEYADKFLFVWGQEECKDIPNPEYEENPEVKPKIFLKPIQTVFDAYPQYNLKNCIIMDDSLEKMAENPKGSFLLIRPDNIEDDVLEYFKLALNLHGDT